MIRLSIVKMLMLQRSNCILNSKNHEELAKLDKCPHYLGSCFLTKGKANHDDDQKVIIIMEKLNKNHI